MSPTATGLYTQMLTAAPVLPEALFRAAFKAAQAAGDRDLLRTLIGREDAPANLALQHAGQDDGLRGVYLGRCRQVDTAAGRAPETRTAVLVRSLTRRTPPPTAVLDALAAFDTKPTKTLATALAALEPAVFTPEQAAAVLQHAGDPSQVIAAHGRATLGARLGPALAAEVLATTEQMWVVATLSYFDVPLYMLAGALVRTARRCDQDPRMYTVGPGLAAAVIGRMYAPRPMNERLALRSMIEAESSNLTGPTGRAVLRYLADITVVPTALRPWDTTPASPPTEGAAISEDTPVHELTAAATSSDPEQLAAVATVVASRPQDDGITDCVLTLLSNPAFATRDRRTLLAAATAHPLSAAHRLWPALRTFDGVSTFSDDPESQQLWVSLFPVETLAAHGWGPLGGTERAPKLLRHWQEQREAGTLETALFREGIRAAASAGLTDDALRALHLESLGIALTGPAAVTRAVTACLSSCLDATLGTSTARWDAYTLLYDHHLGTLGELLDNIAALDS